MCQIKNILITILFFLLIGCKEAGSQAIAHSVEIKNDSLTLPSIGDSLISKASLHLGKPYVAKSLDQNKIEQLTIITSGFDCTTLVETVIAEVKFPNNIAAQIQTSRYRNGIIEDYSSRIHYFTEWIYENRNLVDDLTSTMSCSKPYSVKINYMSTHRNKYHQLADDNIFQKITSMESKINDYTWSYIPKNSMKACEHLIKNGDIIAITTNIKGLDISHLGFAIWKGKYLHLLHASTDEKKVVVSKNTLYHYLQNHTKQTGIMVLRMKQ